MKILTRLVLAVLVLGAAVPAFAQSTEGSNALDDIAPIGKSAFLGPIDASKLAIGPTFGIYPPPVFDPRASWRQEWICRDLHPANVTGYQLVCSGATFLDFHITDCCIPGDHWQLKGKVWDVNPNTGVTTSPGGVPVWSVPGRAYNYGGTPFAPGSLRAYVECTMLNGVDVFPADAVLWFSSDGICTVTPDLARNRIDRSP